MPVSLSPWPPMLLSVFALVGAVLVVVLIVHRRAPQGRSLVAALILAGGLVIAGALFGLAAYQATVASDTWTFGYTLDLRGNGSAPESLIVPIPADEALVAGLQLASGSANWSFVDTPHGRGLFVRFTGSATLGASVSQFPPPEPMPNTIPTMPAVSNCTAQPSNCTGPPESWVWYSGDAGVSLWLSIGSWFVDAYPVSGWGTYDRIAAPVPAV